jgi:3-hydroxybutyrate dehydrogenase
VFLENVAIKRLLEPEDVAALVGWLVSEAAWGVTGSVQTMDLGWTAR